MIGHVVDFYKQLFGKETRNNIRPGDDFWERDEKIFDEEN
jgi:hypothetical protein